MCGNCHNNKTADGGISLRGSKDDANRLTARLESLRIAACVDPEHGAQATRFRAPAEAIGDTAAAARLYSGGHPAPDAAARDEALEREILLALMLSPVRFDYRSYDELSCAIRVRKNIVMAASKTVLAFDTTAAAERPSDCFTYAPGSGFTLVPGKSLIESLRKATQPEVSGRLYSFSCYRATEYVILLALAEELRSCNPTELERLQRQWEKRAIKSGAFHEIFLVEYGSMAAPLPPLHYVPGDRLWFRNPDARSSDVDGYEGSWVFYHGGGEFTNFWKPGQPFTLTSKCLEIHHWRNGVHEDQEGNLRMDESIVDARVRSSLADPDEVQAIVARMMRLRDAKGVYGSGGCIDTTREYPRSIYPGAPRLVLPDA